MGTAKERTDREIAEIEGQRAGSWGNWPNSSGRLPLKASRLERLRDWLRYWVVYLYYCVEGYVRMVVLRQCCSKHYDTCGDAAALIIGVPLYCCERCAKKVSYEMVMTITRDSRVFSRLSCAEGAGRLWAGPVGHYRGGVRGARGGVGGQAWQGEQGR